MTHCDTKLRNLCRDLGLDWTGHDAHGFYLDVTVSGRKFMIDPTPDSIWRKGKLLKSWPRGTCFVRDGSHHYENPTHLAEFNLNTQDGYDKLRAFLTGDILGSTPVSSVLDIFGP